MPTQRANQDIHTTSASDEPIWHPPEAIAAANRPLGLWAWLTEYGSLTERMRGACGSRFNVHLVREYETQFSAMDELLLNDTSSTGRAREVYLCCGDAPWIYARTLIPETALSSTHQWLHGLGERALGDALSAQGGIHRSKLAVAEVDSQHTLYRTAVSNLRRFPDKLWARRSVVAAGHQYLLIRECFLPEPGAPPK